MVTNKEEVKTYKALKKGFDGSRVILPGEIFEFSGKPGKWMKEVNENEKSETSDEAPEPKSKKSKSVI